ncbi:MAG: VOC family protein [Magnetococcales bacterium]|nr:VOC family protein [Magnetococcales bacterium]MBF0151129.1 VOC family protein [Magnetococcales bacterium]MBF0174710.1 VOC family protein [Magnetococcales bacterium]MBF0346791.1 VOC family protein [Magnetococcales bacterium]MBF0630962.1 VOC family protein [Magnetococcales bacterium]
MNVEPYLFFEGRCDEAITLYRNVLGAEVTFLMRFRDSPEPPEHWPSADAGDKVMHANLRIGDTMVMVSDGRCDGQASFKGFSLTLSLTDAGTAERIFTALSEGGQVQMPLGKTFWSPCFGMVQDRFGVAWFVMVHEPPSGGC